MSVNVTTRCPACGSDELLRIDLAVEEQPVAFTACPRCERRWWERDGSPLSLEVVLRSVGRKSTP